MVVGPDDRMGKAREKQTYLSTLLQGAGWNGDPIPPHHHQWLVIFDIFIARRYFGNESDHHSYSWSYDAQLSSLVHMRNAGMPACRFYSAVFLLHTETGVQHT